MADNIANIIIDCGGDERVLQIGNFYNFTSPYFHILGKLINYDPDHFPFLTGDPAGIEIEHMLPDGQLATMWLAADMLDSCDACSTTVKLAGRGQQQHRIYDQQHRTYDQQHRIYDRK